jgi:hypothetical protein
VSEFLLSELTGTLALTEELTWDAVRSAPLPRRRVSVDGQAVSLDDSSCNTFSRFRQQVTGSAAIYVKGVERWSPALVAALCNYYGAGLLTAGISDAEVRVDIFGGMYDLTPGGIHREPCTNRHLVVAGTKSFYFWTDKSLRDYASHEPRKYVTGHGVEEYYDVVQPTTVQPDCVRALSPGQSIYWDGWTWHAASATSPCLSVNIATFRARGEPTAVDQSKLGEVSIEWVESLRSAHESPPESLQSVMARASAAGIRSGKLRGTSNDLAPAKTVIRNTNAPSLWVRFDRHMIVAVAGQAVRVPESAEACALWFCSRSSTSFTAETGADLELLVWLQLVKAVAPA